MADKKGSQLKKIYIPPIIGALMILIGIPLFWSNPAILGNIILLSVVVGIMPYVIIKYLEYERIKSIEEQLPAFMLDLAETQKAGMTLPGALRSVSKTDYGKLTAEIKKMNNQLSWGIPVQEVLDRFAWRMRKSKTINRVVRIIVEAYDSGGDIGRTLQSTAEDIVTINETEKEKVAVMSQHVIVMYAIYFIFVGIIVGLSKTLVPMLQLNIETAAVGGILSFSDPCTICGTSANLFCLPCKVYGILCQMFGLGDGSVCYYRSLFMLMAIVQGIFTGLVAGQIGQGSMTAGVKHSLIMTGLGFSIIMILLHMGVM